MGRVRPRLALVLAAVLSAALAVPATAAGGGRPLAGSVPCSGDGTAREASYRFDGVDTYATYAAPKGRPKAVVAFAHGYSHGARSWRHHAEWAAERGAVAVAPTYRLTLDEPSDGSNPLKPFEARGWRVTEGAQEMVAFAQDLRARCDVQQVIIFGVSMGGNSSALAVAMAGERRAGAGGKPDPLFDWWIDVEPVTNLPGIYQLARAAGTVNPFARNAQLDMEEEFGGSYEQRPGAYHRANPIERVDDIRASGVRGVSIVHAVGDALVPYEHSRELQARLRQVGVRTHLVTILTRSTDTQADGSLDAFAPLPGGPYLTGHADETRTDDHLVMRESLAQLDALLATRSFPQGSEDVLDGRTGQRRNG
jgi:acetyl esterase/lipase